MIRPMLFLTALAFAQAATAQSAADQRQLAAELAAEVEAYRVNLPVRDGVLTISRVDLRGLEIVYIGNVHADFDAAQIARFRQEVRRGLCSQNTRDIIVRGGSFTYDLQDQAGERFVTTVDTCG